MPGIVFIYLTTTTTRKIFFLFEKIRLALKLLLELKCSNFKNKIISGVGTEMFSHRQLVSGGIIYNNKHLFRREEDKPKINRHQIDKNVCLFAMRLKKKRALLTNFAARYNNNKTQHETKGPKCHAHL